MQKKLKEEKVKEKWKLKEEATKSVGMDSSCLVARQSLKRRKKKDSRERKEDDNNGDGRF